MPREGGITLGGDRGKASLVIQSAAVDGGRDMVFHGWSESCGLKSHRVNLQLLKQTSHLLFNFFNQCILM